MLWVAQSLLAALFLFSGVMKSTRSEQQLIASGQTGVEGLPRSLIGFIGISEILGAAGLVLPLLSDVLPVLTPLALRRYIAAYERQARPVRRKSDGRGEVFNYFPRGSRTRRVQLFLATYWPLGIGWIPDGL